MKTRSFFRFAVYGLKTVVLGPRHPILGTIILTDRCNLTCQHCAVASASGFCTPFEEVERELHRFFSQGIRILFFCGGETFLWRDGDKDLRWLVKFARGIGFDLVNVVTNGTLDLELPEANIVFLSVDGTRDTHDLIRGQTFDRILANVARARGVNICVYMAINQLNFREIRGVAELVKQTPNLNCISFNFHTPYPGTAHLSLSPEQRREAAESIRALIKERFPVFNIPCALDHYLSNDWTRPCSQCIVSERGKQFVCGRCIEIPGLCAECGYLFPIEFSLLFRGSPRAIWQVLRTYLLYV